MFRRRSLVLLAIAGCGGAPPQDPSTLATTATAAPAASQDQLAWASTVLECESPTGTRCVEMWQHDAKLAPTQTDALNVLHVACAHLPAACAQLAAWHAERGHALAAAAYQKRARAAGLSASANALALASDLAAIMHVSGDPPRTDPIDQKVGHAPPEPVVQAAPASPRFERKAWPMHAAELGVSSDACSTRVTLDGRPAGLRDCVGEVRPFDADQIAVRNRCDQAVTVAFVGTRSDHSAYANQLRLDRYEAQSLGISHREVGRLTYAVCPDGCRVSGSPDDATAAWTGGDAMYDCARAAKH